MTYGASTDLNSPVLVTLCHAMVPSKETGSLSPDSVALRNRDSRFEMLSVKVFPNPNHPYSCFGDCKLRFFYYGVQVSFFW